jgi:hypothetical protein
MTSREHARRLMLILLASEGTALRTDADQGAGRERHVGGGEGTESSRGTEAAQGFIVPRAQPRPFGPAGR